MGILGTGSSQYAGRYKHRSARGGGHDQGGGDNAVCQNCLQKGHWTYQCKNPKAYKARASCTQQLKDPKPTFLDPSEIPEEFLRSQRMAISLEGRKKRKRRRASSSSSDSSDSGSSTTSGTTSSSSTITSSSSSSSSDASSSGSSSYSSSSASSDVSTESEEGEERKHRNTSLSGKTSSPRSRCARIIEIDRDSQQYYASGKATGRQSRNRTPSRSAYKTPTR